MQILKKKKDASPGGHKRIKQSEYIMTVPYKDSLLDK
jgi:hypothetical protein